MPGETHDLDDVFESVLINNNGRRSLFKMGKMGILWEIDRTNGAFVAAHDLAVALLCGGFAVISDHFLSLPLALQNGIASSSVALGRTPLTSAPGNNFLVWRKASLAPQSISL